VEEASNAADGRQLLDGCLKHLAEEQEREQGRQLIAQLRKPSIESAGQPEDLSADLKALRDLQERARARQGVPIV